MPAEVARFGEEGSARGKIPKMRLVGWWGSDDARGIVHVSASGNY
jgi:hypothetical protein